jgi:hypothetical protein
VVSPDLAATRMVPDPVRRQSLVESDLVELVVRRLRRSGVAEAAFECCLGLGDSMAEGSSAPRAVARAGCRACSGNTEAAVVGMAAPRLAGAAAGCRRSIRTSRRLDFQIGLEQAPWRAMAPVRGRLPTKHEVTCHAPCSSYWPGRRQFARRLWLCPDIMHSLYHDICPQHASHPPEKMSAFGGKADMAFCSANVCF